MNPFARSEIYINSSGKRRNFSTQYKRRGKQKLFGEELDRLAKWNEFVERKIANIRFHRAYCFGEVAPFTLFTLDFLLSNYTLK